MQLTIQDGILCFISSHKLIYTERVSQATISSYFITCGYRSSTAHAIAFGALQERHTTIQLAQLIKLIAISSFNDDNLLDK